MKTENWLTDLLLAQCSSLGWLGETYCRLQGVRHITRDFINDCARGNSTTLLLAILPISILYTAGEFIAVSIGRHFALYATLDIQSNEWLWFLRR